LDQAKMIVSTVHEYETNALILQYLKQSWQAIVSIMSSHKVSDAELLYDLWANYVIVPHVISGHHTAILIEQYEYDIEKYTEKKIEEYGILR
jgi:hypothetical protein